MASRVMAPAGRPQNHEQFELPLGAPSPPAPAVLTAAPPEPAPPPPFGRWLQLQADAAGAIGWLARTIRTDMDFTRRATPDDLRRRLAAGGADDELFDAVDEAEAAWTMAA